MGIRKNLENIHRRIAGAAERSGRGASDITLVAVSKTMPIDRVIEAVKAGVMVLGENRVQEAGEKISDFKSQISDYEVEWHLIGNLQKNKAKNAVRLFDLIHSVDSLSLAETLNRLAGEMSKTQRVLVQVKLSDEPAKHGVSEDDCLRLLDSVAGMPNLQLEGLMTIPPFFDDPEDTRDYFRKLRLMADHAVAEGHLIKELSMGMSNDFEIAIEEGSTMVRVGTAIFGQRNYA